jgi:hypothetical protein
MSDKQRYYCSPYTVRTVLWSLDIQRNVLNQLETGCKYRIRRDTRPSTTKLTVEFEERSYKTDEWDHCHLTHANRKILMTALQKSINLAPPSHR